VSHTSNVNTGTDYDDTITYTCLSGYEKTSGNLVRTSGIRKGIYRIRIAKSEKGHGCLREENLSLVIVTLSLQRLNSVHASGLQYMLVVGIDRYIKRYQMMPADY
jgi:hypothetical protein